MFEEENEKNLVWSIDNPYGISESGEPLNELGRETEWWEFDPKDDREFEMLNDGFSVSEILYARENDVFESYGY